MKKVIFALTVLVFTAIANTGADASSISPSSISVSPGFQLVKTVSYSLVGSCPQSISNSGQFVGSGEVLGSVNNSLVVNLQPSVHGLTGSASESLVIPASLVEKALRLGVTRFLYQRQFTFFCNKTSQTLSVQIKIIPKAEAELRITRLQLYFENRRAEMTVKKNQSPKVYAEIRFIGSGLLEGYWEADGLRLFNVFKQLTYGKSITLETPDIPQLPAFETGVHRVRFVITNPVGQIGMPEAIYYVTAEEQKTVLPIRLISPNDNSTLAYAPLTFTWEREDKTGAYLIEFLEENTEKPLFSAYRVDNSYTLPEILFKSVFKAGKKYIWRVKGFDGESNITGESPSFRFSFKVASSSQNMISGESYAGEIHGTAVARTIGAGINGFGTEGVAAGAGLLALRVCRQNTAGQPDGECYTYAILKAADTALLKKAGIAA